MKTGMIKLGKMIVKKIELYLWNYLIKENKMIFLISPITKNQLFSNKFIIITRIDIRYRFKIKIIRKMPLFQAGEDMIYLDK